jgi:hypothetical protein
MADWIKVETTSSQKIEVLTIADLLDIDEHAVFGKLVILWCWADANTIDGNAINVTKRMIDRITCVTGFADAMLHDTVRWLTEDGNGTLSFSNFDRHNGKGAKKRANTARRVNSHRNVTQDNDKCNAQSVTESEELALPDKRREREEKDNTKQSRFTPPTIEEIHSFSLEKGFDSLKEVENFFYFYDSKNWMVGKNKMQKWKSSYSRWISGKLAPVTAKTNSAALTAEERREITDREMRELAESFK